MSAFVRKEIRMLLPVWGVAMALAILPVWFFWPTGWQGMEIPTAPDLAVFAPFGLGVLLLGVYSFGQEFNTGTFASWLVQPISRQRLWLVKTATLAVALALSIGAFYLSNRIRVNWVLETSLGLSPLSGSAEFQERLATRGVADAARIVKIVHEISGAASHNAFKVGTIFALLAFSSGLWTTLLLRQITAALCLAFLVPMALSLVLSLITSNFPGPVESGLEWAAVLIYAVVGFVWAHRMFLRAQDTQWTGGIISLPERRGLADEAQIAGRAPKRQPFRALLFKEFQLHQITLIVSFGFLVSHLATLVIRLVSADYLRAHAMTRMMLESFPFLWLILPALVGSMSIAEERKLGTLEGALCLPTTRRLQFITKLIVALVLGVLLGALMPSLLEELGILIGCTSPSSEAGLEMFSGVTRTTVILFVGSLLIVTWSVLASSLTRNTLQALGLAVLALVVTGMATKILANVANTNWDEPALWRGLLISLIGWPVMVAIVVLLAYWNYQRVFVDARTWRRNLFTPLASLAGVMVVTSLIHNRAWEVFMRLEPAHGPALMDRSNFTAAPKISASDVRIAVLLPDGRIWLRQRNVRVNERKSSGRTIVSLNVNGPWYSGFAAGTNWQDVAVTREQCFAIQTDGSLWDLSRVEPWKYNGAGPVRFGDGVNWTKISVGGSCFTALKSDGTLWMWGRQMILSNNVASYPRVEKPVQVGSDHNWIAVCTAFYTSAAMKSDGTIWKWNFVRTVYNEGTNIASSVEIPEPWLILPNRDVVSINATTMATTAVCEDGSLWIGGGDASYHPEEKSRSPETMHQAGLNTLWQDVRVGGFVDQAVAIRKDGSLSQFSRWYAIQGSPHLGPFRARMVNSSHSDWIAICVYRDAFLALAADGSLCIWGTSERDDLSFRFQRYNPGDLLARSRVRAYRIAELR